MIRIGLYGNNGHQIHRELGNHPHGHVTATALFPIDQAPSPAGTKDTIRHYNSLDEMLSDPSVDLISLCSPRRSDQASDAIKALRAGKHVLAEKPAALSEADLDLIIETARATGRHFHEMAGTAFGQPYYAMRKLVLSGQLGEIVQIIAEKSYPYFEGRPGDEKVDGGQIGQNAIHALRFVEHVACTPISAIRAFETTLGAPTQKGSLCMAASLILTLENGGVASLSSNYLNPSGTGIWGYESLKILGSKGMVESREGGRTTRLVIGRDDLGSLDTRETPVTWLDTYLLALLGRSKMPLSLKDELSPTRWSIRAKKSLQASAGSSS